MTQAVAQAEAQRAAERVEAADIVAAQTPEQAEIAARLVQAPLEEPTTMGIIGQLGYVGQPIGLATALLQRGLWNPKGMVIDVTAKNVNKYRECACQGQEVNNCCRSRDMVYVMSQQPDFLKQRSALQELVYGRGHLVIMSVKCTPEMAGNGIEYCWGVSKLYFRRHINDRNFQNHANNVNKAMSTKQTTDRNGKEIAAPLSLERVHKFSRRVRTYRNLYREHGNNLTEIAKKQGVTGYALIEKMCKKASTHRNIVEQEINFLNDVLFA